MEIFRQFAESSSGAGSLLTTLGIDWKILIFQILAFLVTLWLLGKFVYPVLMKSVDQRQEKIEASAKASEKAEKAAAETEDRVAKLMVQARKEADAIIETAKSESSSLIEKAETESRQRAEQITTEAQTEIKREVASAKKALREQTIDLVASATKKVIGKTVDVKLDNKLISETVKEIEK